ncbi:hypothetical protein [Afifella marina]|uniref:Uncharacterized protein n=1 Tax=Afifella marina DSM 2698 TaxID=1120955 RepID=A0A1G5N7F8_AFIMA|nr:hypothetical protein [Afifella marina]MBK1622543.1 hypothetical protein [Afifella marina DSM 2698]MBK1626742.1 hypothetical protein [Afifella marina]MBK5919328.1 hypothetical protein [Afifella marina]RAI21361.1 hypothetical protein CH311_07795 [Afifella marina DSM 2698]SCZ32848.1 hypothetical protein SAMN03080610_01591 [Afifella marina DSM 2698]
MARALRESIDRLELTTKVTLAVLALASGVYTYLGVRGLLDGSASIVFFGAIIYSAAVSVGIYAFWTYLMRFLPLMRERGGRRALWAAMGIGSIMIVAMSSWLNAAALAGSAALEQHLANTVEDYTQDLDAAHNNALAAQSLLPDIQMAAERFSRLADEERSSGALTGTSGSGTVVQLLNQMSQQLRGLADEVAASRERVKSLFDQGSEHLASMRRLVSASGPIDPRANSFAEEAVSLAGVIASLQQTSVAPAVKRAAEDLSLYFIAPVADGGDADLRQRQTAVVGNVAQAVQAQSAALATAADNILSEPHVQPKRFVPLSTPEAVLLYASDFLPSWAGAISIDLLPAVLVLMLVAVHGAIRHHEDPDIDEHAMTAGDMLVAMRLYERMRAADPARTAEPAVLAPAEATAATARDPETTEPRNITTLTPKGSAPSQQGGHGNVSS